MPDLVACCLQALTAWYQVFSALQQRLLLLLPLCRPSSGTRPSRQMKHGAAARLYHKTTHGWVLTSQTLNGFKLKHAVP
jgi:hypothetical protein